MINSIFKPKGSRIWRWKFRLCPADKTIGDVSLGTSDKQVAEKRRGELLREKEHERAGFIPPKATRDAANRKLAEHLQDFLGDMRRRGKSESRVAMALMRHSDRRLTDKIYTDENLLGTWSAFDHLPNYTEQASQIASQILVATGQNVSLPVTTSCGPEVAKTLVNQGVCHGLAQSVTTGHDAGNGGSGGARTRNLCRDRAAL
jgi:hypothetical protein